jgi:hypothetical protein
MEAFLASLFERACVRALGSALTVVWRVLRRHRLLSRRSSHWVHDASVRAYIWKVPEESGDGPSRDR